MTAFEQIKNEIERHKKMMDDWDVQDSWYRHSTAGIKQKALYEYAIELLESIRDNCDEGQR